MKMFKRFILMISLILFGGSLLGQNTGKWYYGSGKASGYAESVPTSSVYKVAYDEFICDGSTTMMSVMMRGGDLFAYAWYEVGKESDIKSRERYFTIPNCTADYNGKKYVCKITDLRAGTVLLSEEIVLNVIKFPEAKISNPNRDTTLCNGMELELEASPVGDEYTYTWEGAGIMGSANTNRVFVQPTESTTYSVTVANKNCSRTATRKVEVNAPEVDIQDVFYAEEGVPLVITPVKKGGEKFNWLVDGQEYRNQNSLILNNLNKITKVVIQAEWGNNCVALDSAEVIPDGAFKRYGGGADDGFVQSQQKLQITGIKYSGSICLGENAYFSLNVDVKSTYAYEWWKVGSPNVKMGTGSLFTIQNCDHSDAGEYYCVCTDLDTKVSVTSPKVMLVVQEIPNVRIEYPRDTLLCLGERLTLRASALNSDEEKYVWIGYNIQTDRSKREVIVAPTERTEYSVMVDNGVCRNTAKVVVDVKNMELKVPGTLDIFKNEQAKLSLPREDRVQYTWTIDGASQTTTGDFVYTPLASTQLKVKKSWNNGRCSIQDSVRIYLKDFGVGTGNHDEDGYTESKLTFKIIKVEASPMRVCVGEEARLNIEVSGYDIYRYEWYRVDGSTNVKVSNEKEMILASVVKANGASYFCKVIDVRTGDFLTSNKVSLEVLDAPIAQVASPSNGHSICYGTSVNLQARVFPGELIYRWDGPDIIGDAERSVVKVSPKVSSNYELTVSNGVCSRQDYIDIVVNRPKVTVPEVIYGTGRFVRIVPKVEPESLSVEWSWGTMNSSSPIFYQVIGDAMLVKVKATDGTCTATDSTRVYVKKTVTYGGGNADGFIESDLTFRIAGVDYTPVICENTDVEFTVRVVGSGLYTYEWRKTGDNNILSKERNLLLTNCDLSLSGTSYYCTVTDLQQGKTLVSETQTLTVNRGPKAKIGLPAHGETICFGETIRLDARLSEDSKPSPTDVFTYFWEGENISYTNRAFIVDVMPTETQTYSVMVKYEECVDYDTITINVAKPQVTVPSVKYVSEGEPMKLTASVAQASVGAWVDWWVDGRFYPKRTTLELPPLTQSTVARAVLVDGKCQVHDSTNIYLRTIRFYKGGEDDGFMESCEVPVITDDSDLVLGCGGEDSVAIVVKYEGSSVRSFKWQKYNELTAAFEELASASNITGLGSPQLIVHPVTADNYGSYRCMLDNECGYVYSKIYEITNSKRPELSDLNPNKREEYCEGAKNAMISMSVINEDGVHYRWYKKNPDTQVKQQLTPEVAFDNRFLRFLEITKADDAIYIGEARNACGVTLDSLRLTVIGGLKIAKQIRDTIVCNGTDVKLWVQITGGAMHNYTLLKLEDDATLPGGVKETIVYTGTVSHHVLPMVAVASSGTYKWRVKSACEMTVESVPFKLTVETPPVFKSQTPDTLFCIGNRVQIEAHWEDSPTAPLSNVKYSWEKLGSGTLYTKTNIHVINVFDPSTTGDYVCYAKNTCPKVAIPDPITLGLRGDINVIAQPMLANPTYCEGKGIKIRFAVDKPNEVDSVRWFRGNIPVKNEFRRVMGADSYLLQIDTLRLEEAGMYRAMVYSPCNATGMMTASVSLRIDERAKFVKHIVDGMLRTTVCQGTEETLTVQAKGAPEMSYMWLCNNRVISGATGNQLKVRFDSTSVYTCFITNHCGGEYSNVQINVNRADTFSLVATNRGHYCAGTAGAKLTLAGSDTNYVYRLYKDGAAGENYTKQIFGLDAEFVGAPLNWGIHKKGKYRVIAKNMKTLCDFVMPPGEITVTEDTLPKIYNLEMIRPLCNNGTDADIILTGSAPRNTVEYTLHHKGIDGWERYPKQVYYGTGDTLRWNKLPAGRYLVKAYDQETGCSANMRDTLTLISRPNPGSVGFAANGRDTIYCEGSVSGAKLMVTSGVQEKVTYTLIRDGVLTAMSDKVQPIEWLNVEMGTYSVEAKNEWGCTTVSGNVRIGRYDAPIAHRLSGGGYYCEPETGTKEIKLTPSTLGIKYSLFKEGNMLAIQEQIGTGVPLQFDVPFENATYYVLAEDLTTGCTKEMTSRVKVKGGKMTLDHVPAYINLDNDIEIQLELLAKDTIGETAVVWDPADLDITGGKYKPWTYMILGDPSDLLQYKATVTDSACTKTHTINVILSGRPLAIDIRQEGCVNQIPNDTLKVCKEAKFALCGSYSGGNGTYKFEWSMDGAVLATTSDLVGMVASRSGYLVYKVKSGTVTKLDSVWMEVRDLPGADLTIVNNGTNCVAPGDSLKMVLSNTTLNDSYSLEYSKLGATYLPVGVSNKGDASGKLTLSKLFTDDGQLGFYRVKVARNYGEQVCSEYKTGIEVIRGTLKGKIGGGGEYCIRGNGVDTIFVDTTEVGTQYRLICKRPGSSRYEPVFGAEALSGNNDTVRFIGDWGNGEFRIVAERTPSGCVDTMLNMVKIVRHPLPAIGNLIADDTTFCKTGNLNVTIGISDCIARNHYSLYREETAEVPILMGQSSAGDFGDVIFGTNFNDIGKYYVVADDGTCTNKRGYVRIALPPVQVNVSAKDTTYCENERGATLTIRAFEVNHAITYKLYKEGNTEAVGQFGGLNSDTLYYKGVLPEGNYVVQAEIGTCRLKMNDVVRIHKQPQPLDKTIFTPLTACNGTPVRMGVNASQTGVRYEVWQHKDGVSLFKASANGTGADLLVTQLSEVGKYTIMAVDTVTGCSKDSIGGVYEVLQAPQKFDIIAVDTVYCANPKNPDVTGAQIGLSGSQQKKYYLQKLDDVIGEYKDFVMADGSSVILNGIGVPNDPIFFAGKFKTGKYRIRTEECGQYVVSGVLEVIEQVLPETDILVNIVGNGCIDSTFVVTLNATEVGTSYALYKGTVKVNGVPELIGNSNAQSWTLANLSGGSYRIEAKLNGCKANIVKTIEVDSVPVIGTLVGGKTVMCQHDQTEITLARWEAKAKYTLFKRPGDVKVADGKLNMNKDKILFEPVGVGKFYAIGNRGDCKSYTPDIKIDSTIAPNIQNVNVEYSACANPNLGSITVNNMADSLEYELVWPGDERRETFFAVVNGDKKEFSSLGLGMYKLRVKALNGCFSQYDTLRINQSVPAEDTIVGKFGYCNGTLGAELTMRSTTQGIFYLLTNVETGVRVDSLYNSTKTVFRNKLSEGDYLFRRERRGYMGGCVLEDTIHIRQYPDPSIEKEVEVLGTAPLCAGNNYEIQVKNTENEVLYLLENQDGMFIDTLIGDGNHLKFDPISTAGRYRILPKAGGVCGKFYVDTVVVINKLPAEVTAKACTYCIEPGDTNDRGCPIEIYGGSPNVNYVLMNSASQPLDTVTGSIFTSYVSFDPFPQGSYKIFGQDQSSMCFGLVDTVKIDKGTEPHKFTVGTDGGRCGNDIAVGTSDGSEGAIGDTIDYYLYRSGREQAVAGPLYRFDGQNIEFPKQTAAGIYKIYAIRRATGCGAYMNDSIVIHKALIADSLVAHGSYCENTSSGLLLTVDKSVDEWRYYIQKNGVSGDTLKGQDGISLMWSEFRGQKIRAGVYKLYSLTACGVSSLMDTIVIDTNNVPKKQLISGGNRFLCENEPYTVRLDTSEAGVKYILMKDGVTEKTVVGGDTVLFGTNFKGAGVYTVMGTNIKTGCTDTVGSMQVKTAPRPQDPGVAGENICLDAMVGRKLVIRLNNRDYDNLVSYQLRRIYGPDTTIVDIIDGTSDDPDEMFREEFAPQNSVGYYDVVAISATCREVYPQGGGFRIGNVPAQQTFAISGDVPVCKGQPVEIMLEGSEKEVIYTLYETHNVVDPDTVPVGVIRRGTGSALIMDSVYNEGIYLVKASSGCEVWMPNRLNLTHKPMAKLELLKGGYTLCKGDSTQIDLMGETDTGVRAAYLIYAPGATAFDRVNSDGTGASTKTPKFYKTPGYYKVKVTVPGKCQQTDSVLIREKELPTIFDLQADGNDYLCGDQIKKIKLNGQEIGAQYHLYRQENNGGDWSFVDMKEGGREIVFELNRAGKYIVKAQSTTAPVCMQQMNGMVTLMSGSEIRQIRLEAVNGSYCDKPTVTEKGKVRLVSSDLNTEYQLLKDGIPFGAPRVTTVAGDPIVWDQLEGGMPRDNRFPGRKVGIDYTVVAYDLLTHCPQNMLGIVNIVAERNIEFDDRHFGIDKWCCVGDNLTLDIEAFGGNVNYTWKKDGVVVQSGLNSPYVIRNAQPSDNGSYKCILQNSCSIDSTAVIKVKPRMLVDINDKMRDSVICNLSPKEIRKVELRSDISNATTYKWEVDGVEVAGANTSFLEIAVTKQFGSKKYVCIAGNDCGVLTDTAVVSVDSVPRIMVSKLRVDTLCLGSDYRLNVTASAPVQWLQGHTTLSQVGETLLIPGIEKKDAGVYFAESTSGCGTTREQVGTLWIDDTIKVVGGSPENMSVCASNKLDLFITTNPSDRVSYRWENAAGDLLGTGKELKGIDLSRITDREARFRVIYSNKCTYGVKETRVQLNKYIEFDTNYPPREMVICSGQVSDTILHVVLPNGDRNVEFKWYFHSLGKDAVELLGINDTVRIPLNTKSTGAYYCKVGNPCGDTISRVTWVSVDTIVKLTSSLPETMSVCAGSKLELTLSASGGGTIFNWMVLRPGDTRPVKYKKRPLLGEDVCTFELPTTTEMNGTKIWCEVSNSCSSVLSDTTVLSVRPPVAATIEGGAQICAGDAGLIVVTLTNGALPWSYRYKKDGVEKTRADLMARTDTLKVTAAGMYELVWLTEDSGCQKAGALGEVELQVVERAKVTMQLAGNATVCPAGETAFRVQIQSESLGPWKLEIRKQSNGDVASDIIESEEAILTYKKDTTFKFNPLQTESYYPRVKSLASDGFECEGETIGDPIEVTVQAPVHVTANALTDAQRTFGKCRPIDLKALFNAQPDNGQYLIGKHPVPGGSWVIEPSEEKQDTIGYRVVSNGCETVVELGKLFFVDRPEASIEISQKNLCPSLISRVKLRAKGAYPLQMTYVIRMLNTDGSLGMVSTDTKTFTAKDTVLDLSAAYQSSLGGMIYEIIDVRDKYNCPLMTPIKKDTVYFRPPLQYLIESKVGTGAWKSSKDVSDYTIASSDSVEVRVKFVKGQMPWMINVMDVPSGSKSFMISNLYTNEQQFALKDAGLYSINANDVYTCRSNEFNADYVIQKYDTAFVKLNVLLEGPWRGTKMVSQVESLIDKRGLSRWPETGGKAVIDWVEVEVWSEKLTFISSQPGILLEDGTVIDRNGRDVIALANARSDRGLFHIAIRQRNHLSGMTIAFDFSTATKLMPAIVDFTRANNLYHSMAIDRHFTNVDGKWMLSAGEVGASNLITMREPNQNALKQTKDITSLITTVQTLELDVNFNGLIEWPGWGGNTNDLQLDWVRSFKNRNKFSDVPVR